MKAITTVIAVLLLLVITLGLVGMAYTVMVGFIPTKNIDVIEVTCSPGTAYWITVKNLDTKLSIGTGEITVRIDGSPVSCAAWYELGKEAVGTTIASIGPQKSGVCKVTPGGPAGTYHRVKVVGPSNSDEVEAYCI